MTSPHAPTTPGLDREEPDLWQEDDIPTPAADEAEDAEHVKGSDAPRE